MTSMLEVRDLSVHLGGRRRWLRRSVPPVRAVREVNLDLRPGEILGVVGESGCGKTTLGRTILGLQREAAGEIRLEGRSVGGLAPREARQARAAIQYVHQDAGAALDPWWSLGRTLEEALLIHGVTAAAERRERVDAILAAVGLDATVRPRYPHELSGGQLRRVALARILVLRPKIVILDEPTSGLDMSVQAAVLNLLLDLRRRFGLSYLFISHDLSVVRRLCDRVAVMYLGRVVELAPAETLFAAPLHPYTRTLLAAAPSLDPSTRPATAALQGEPPSAARLPPGCAFAARCPHAAPRCRSEDPPLEHADDGRQVACHRWRDLPGHSVPGAVSTAQLAAHS
ncbi:ABC transporter ATP-binding protein [Roseomonas sp. E05]|uniref:oligopeptide/dipeptide ABC transporter ATP-binding protein n=1 Tax=Roseomonas sp. E05 TaxID=3046310 RepID=UPI0024B98BB4|nr:ABC transporter ATP-binding protein [Roseomonas sp. E05]MDJ0389244.1 ABC transporter ATP-binding protein [Roseomonas sp. E05]